MNKKSIFISNAGAIAINTSSFAVKSVPRMLSPLILLECNEELNLYYTQKNHVSCGTFEGDF